MDLNNVMRVGSLQFFFDNLRCIPHIPLELSVVFPRSLTSTGSFVTSGRSSSGSLP